MISTKDIPGGGKVTPKTLQPGNVNIKVNKIYLEKFPFGENAYHVMLDCEGPALGGDFEGFFIDKDNESLGRHAGQVGRIKANQWAYQDKVLNADISIDRDVEITRFLKNLAIATDCLEWYEAQDSKHETIESLVEKMNEDAPFKDKFISACIAGKEYENKSGYTNYDLFFPKFSKTGVPFENAAKESTGRVFKFNESDHIIRKKVKEVDQFEPANNIEGDDFEV